MPTRNSDAGVRNMNVSYTVFKRAQTLCNSTRAQRRRRKTADPSTGAKNGALEYGSERLGIKCLNEMQLPSLPVDHLFHGKAKKKQLSRLTGTLCGPFLHRKTTPRHHLRHRGPLREGIFSAAEQLFSSRRTSCDRRRTRLRSGRATSPLWLAGPMDSTPPGSPS